MRSKLKAYGSLIRPYQWLKNLLIFSPLFFSGKFFEYNSLYKVALGTLCFCFLSSTGYIMNDWVDRKRDRFHPGKKNRPLSSGIVTGYEAIGLSILLLIVAGIILVTTSFPLHFFKILFLFISIKEL